MIGLVLEGGGARGSYHIGAYKGILEEGIKIDGITGTSIGSLNGAMIVQGDFDIAFARLHLLKFVMWILMFDLNILLLQLYMNLYLLLYLLKYR
jgi:predicted acylesterase/phospholipase RssA